MIKNRQLLVRDEAIRRVLAGLREDLISRPPRSQAQVLPFPVVVCERRRRQMLDDAWKRVQEERSKFRPKVAVASDPDRRPL
jgi:hypothetical protein